MTPPTTAISVNRLRKTYGTAVAVDDVSFEVRPGEIFGIVGPNGSGKTTTVECLQGLRHPDSGDVHVLGLDPRREGRSLRTQIGSQLQESALPDRLKVWEALDLFAALAPHPADWRQLAENWGLTRHLGQAFANLSGGQRQRLLVALALVNNPRLVFFDEMTAGLDPASRRVAWDLVRQVRDRGATVVLVTHFMDEAEHLCDRIAVFRAGRVVDVDTPSGLVARFAGGSVVRFSCRDEDLSWLTDVPGVAAVGRSGVAVEIRGSGPVLVRVAAALAARGLEPDDLQVDRPTLEDAFLRLIGTEEQS